MSNPLNFFRSLGEFFLSWKVINFLIANVHVLVINLSFIALCIVLRSMLRNAYPPQGGNTAGLMFVKNLTFWMFLAFASVAFITIAHMIYSTVTK